MTYLLNEQPENTNFMAHRVSKDMHMREEYWEAKGGWCGMSVLTLSGRANSENPAKRKCREQDWTGRKPKKWGRKGGERDQAGHNWYIHKREDIKELAQGRDGQEGRGNDVLAKVEETPSREARLDTSGDPVMGDGTAPHPKRHRRAAVESSHRCDARRRA
ncbi:hypothetical protein B0H14DRAFT_3143755 [Mycena olivaceomarginata]|nr:hypothetical protein B0H14DRAFT_3143755 [Mycena olivaceomarginata]